MEEILKIFKHKTKIIFDAKKPTAVQYRVLNNNKYNKLFKKTKKTNLKDGLKKTINWFQSEEYRE